MSTIGIFQREKRVTIWAKYFCAERNHGARQREISCTLPARSHDPISGLCRGPTHTGHDFLAIFDINSEYAVLASLIVRSPPSAVSTG